MRTIVRAITELDVADIAKAADGRPDMHFGFNVMPSPFDPRPLTATFKLLWNLCGIALCTSQKVDFFEGVAYVYYIVNMCLYIANMVFLALTKKESKHRRNSYAVHGERLRV